MQQKSKYISCTYLNGLYVLNIYIFDCTVATGEIDKILGNLTGFL